MAQMPEEGRKFGIVDRNWRDIMGTAVQDAHALVVTAQENMLGRLKESNCLLEEIQKGLNDYLEKKRLYFPRCVGGGDKARQGSSLSLLPSPSFSSGSFSSRMMSCWRFSQKPRTPCVYSPTSKSALRG